MTDCSKDKNSLKVKLKNFQSISKGELEFTQGINIIVGQSNSGKSAILRAIKGAILNPSGSQKYIKNGTSGFEVSLDYNGNTIEWSRTSKSPKYTINGEEYLKVGSSNLTNFLDKSGFVLDENKNLMNVESELELPFPFDKNNSELFKLFEKNIFCISDSTAITKLIKADEDETNTKKENAEYELERYKSKLSAIEELESEIDVNWLVSQRKNIAENIDKTKEISLDISKLHDIISLGKVIGRETPRSQKLPDLQVYLSMLQDVLRLDDLRGVGNILSKSIPTASTPTFDMTSVTDLEFCIEQLERAEKILSILRPIEGSTARVMNEEYTSLRSDLLSLSRLKEQGQNVQKELSELKSEINRLREEKSKYKVCPLCGGEING